MILSESAEIERIKIKLEDKLSEMAERMTNYDFLKENYKMLFPDDKISTPIGEVTLGKHQFEKLEAKGRGNLLGAMYQTLTDPVAIIYKDEAEKKALLFIKTFKNETVKVKGVLSVVVDIDGKKISISTHRRNPKDVIKIIKKTADVVYLKPTSGHDGWE